MPRFAFPILTLALAVGLTAVFWLPLWTGGGFVGGDVYSFFLPQKTFFAERLAAGEFPLWNNRTGHGYPLLGESQTGAFYPFHLLFYSTLDVGTAFNVNHLLHYVLAFAFCAMYARSVGIGVGGALLAATTFVYGWFPVRCALEWAVITGAWLPAALWCTEKFLQTRHWRYAIGLSATLAVQMFAGHFQLAFLTQLLLAAYIPARVWLVPLGRNARPKEGRSSDPPPSTILHPPCRLTLFLFAGIACGFALAAVQLFPTWDFKQRSHRAAAGKEHRLAQGSLPARCWSQCVLPWPWYSPLTDRDAELQRIVGEQGLPNTNQVEAHLYFGLIPLGLALFAVALGIVRRDRFPLFWLLIGVAALLYTPGWLIPYFDRLPGFSYFQGPGRYGVLTTFAVALLAGLGLDRLLSRPRTWPWVGVVLLLATAFSAWSLADDTLTVVQPRRMANPLTIGGVEVTPAAVLFVGCACIAGLLAAVLASRRRAGPSDFVGTMVPAVLIAATLLDLWIVARMVTFGANTVMVDDPPIDHLAESPIRRFVEEADQPLRLNGPGGNLPTVFGCANYPPYLTFGPREYVEPSYWQRHDPQQDYRRMGITHVLILRPIGRWTERVPTALVWQGRDPVLNPALARFREPVFLYELTDGSAYQRVTFADREPGNKARITEYAANRVVIHTEVTAAGTLVLKDLFDPDWAVTVDGDPAEAQRYDELFRAVDVPSGEHEVVWTYRPASVYWGGAVSLFALLLLAGVAHVRFRHRGRWRFLDTPSHR